MIIFVGSTSFSGSTLLDVMLGHGKKCFACGEVYAFFWPRKPLHYDPPCTCGDSECQIWPMAKKHGPKNIYPYLFSQGYNIISDSSKNLKWFKFQEKFANERGDDLKTILIYKHPANFLYSKYKRDQRLSYQIWYKYYLDFLNHFRRSFIVSYEDLTQHPAKTLEAICDRLDIPYFEGKEHFWKGVSHHLFGADSVRLQFYDKTGERFSKLASSLRDRRKGVLHSVEKHKTVYHVEEWREKLPKKYHELPDHVIKMFGILEEEKIRI